MTRVCGECNLCCVLAEVQTLEKPANKVCEHCDGTRGCRIYGLHPGECKDFRCLWLDTPTIADKYRPDKAHLYITGHPEPSTYTARVDPDYPLAWWTGDGRKLIERVVECGMRVVVVVGKDTYMVEAESGTAN